MTTGPADHLDADHLDTDTLADYAEGLLDQAAARGAAGHLAGCRDCSAILRTLADVTAMLRTAPPEPMPEYVAARITAALAGSGVPAARDGSVNRPLGAADASGTAGTVQAAAGTDAPAVPPLPAASVDPGNPAGPVFPGERAAEPSRPVIAWSAAHDTPSASPASPASPAPVAPESPTTPLVPLDRARRRRRSWQTAHRLPLAAAAALVAAVAGGGLVLGLHAGSGARPSVGAASGASRPVATPATDFAPNTTRAQGPRASNGTMARSPSVPVPLTEAGLPAAAKRLFTTAPTATPTRLPAAVTTVPGARACTMSTSPGSRGGGIAIAAERGTYQGQTVMLLIYATPAAAGGTGGSGVAVVVTTPCDTPGSTVLRQFPVAR